MRPDRMILSTYLDDEIPSRFRREIERAIEADADVRADFDEIQRLRLLLPPVDPDAVSQSAQRSWNVITRRIHQPVTERRFRSVRVSIPALGVAAVAVIALVVGLAYSVLNAPEPSAESYLTERGGKDVAVTIRVDGSDMERVLQWLVDKDMLGEISIQLPEQQFRIVGDPVFVKPAQFEQAVRE